jgi:hypothetical protein
MCLLKSFGKLISYSVLGIVFLVTASVSQTLGQTACVAGQVVINEVYVSGGVTGATYKNDFVEIYNRSATACSLTNFSVQSATGNANNFTSLVTFPTGLTSVIQPGAFFLVQFGGDPLAAGVALPPSDFISAVNLDNTAGKVAMVNIPASMTGNCATNLTNSYDFVGYGVTNCAEGNNPENPGGTATTSIQRIVLGVDTNNNGVDFASIAPSPTGALAPTAASVSVSGRVIAPQQFGLTNALVTLTDMQGNARTVLTGKFGSFHFSQVVAGETYILTVSSKRYTYAPQVITVNEDLTGVNFSAQ